MSTFSRRHIGPNAQEKAAMLNKIGVASVAELIDKTIPAHIRLSSDLAVDNALTEQEYLQHISQLAASLFRLRKPSRECKVIAR